MVRREDLPLNSKQQAALQARAEDIRAAVESVLPSRVAQTRRHQRSLADLEAFRLGSEPLDKLQLLEPSHPAVHLLRDALLGIAEAHHHYAPERKRMALLAARSSLGRAVGALLLSQSEAHTAIAVQLELGAIRAVSGLLRWVERLGRQR